MRKIFFFVRVLLPPTAIAVLAVMLRGGKDILTGIYFLFPLIYVLAGIFWTKNVFRALAVYVLSAAAFMVPINMLYNMGDCIDLLIVYTVLFAAAYAIKQIIRKKIKK